MVAINAEAGDRGEWCTARAKGEIRKQAGRVF
jgi:hypothetical protein